VTRDVADTVANVADALLKPKSGKRANNNDRPGRGSRKTS
jgi:hypothetical protein